MFRHIALTATAVALLTTTTSFARAADQDEVVGDKIYGNLRLNTHSYLDKIGGTDVLSGSLGFGGKVAYESGSSYWGYQADIDIDSFDSAWMEPVPAAAGSLTVYDMALHATYRSSETGKVGAYLGFVYADSAFGGPGFGASRSLALGVEGLSMVSESTWVQGRIGVYDPIFVNITGAGSQTDLIGDAIGGTVGASVHHAWNSNFSTRVAANLTYVAVSGAADQQILTIGANGNYTFDSMPVSVGLSAGYSEFDLGGEAPGGITLGSNLTWSFGGPSIGSTGKLFSGGALGFGL
jgi:hypothetical protein